MYVCFITLSTPKHSRLHVIIQRSDFSQSMYVRLRQRHECDSFHVFMMTVTATELRYYNFSPS